MYVLKTVFVTMPLVLLTAFICGGLTISIGAIIVNKMSI